MKNFSAFESKSLFVCIIYCLIVILDACNPGHQDTVTPNGARKGISAANSVDPNESVEYETVTVLGTQLPNPYTLANMQQAYARMTGNNGPVSATDIYVRFRPTSLDQLKVLEEDYDLELFDEPLDYEILQEGDYYQDPSIPDEEITWQYSVVPAGFSFPSGITYEVLAYIHIPTNLDVEQEAERLAGLNADGDGLAGGANRIVPEDCPEGYTRVGEYCVANTPNTIPTNPQGKLLVDDTQLGNQGVRKARVVAKRWFKIERMVTDDNGNYRANKNFRNKVKVLVKFKNNDAIVRGMRGVRFWQFFFPVKYKIGVFRGNDLNTINYLFARNGNPQTKGARYWSAATVHNAVQHYKDLVATQGTSNPPGTLKILLTNYSGGVNGSTPLYGIRNSYGIAEAYIRKYVGVPTSTVYGAISGPLEKNVDMTIGYGANDVTSDNIVEVVFHELSHAATYNQAGANWYNSFVYAVTNEIVNNSGNTSPYGTGNTSFSPIIALGESWAYHYGHFLADVRYGNSSSCQIEQTGGGFFCPTTGTGHPHLDVLEGFIPGLNTDPFQWIPKGIYLDLNDNNNEGTPIIDEVFGYTNQQMFSAIEPDVQSPQSYRDRLLSKNANYQAAEVQNLFQRYGY